MVSFDLSSLTPHEDRAAVTTTADDGTDHNDNPEENKTVRGTPHPNKWLFVDVRGEEDDDDEVLRLLRTGHDHANDHAYNQRDLRQGQREPMLEDMCITNVPSPTMDGIHSHKKDSGDDEVREEEGPLEDREEEDATHVPAAAATATTMTHQHHESQASSSWEHWLETSTTGSEPQSTVPNLESYLLAKQLRYDAKQAFEDAMEESLSGLNQAMTVDLIQDTVGVVDLQQSERLDQLETNILLTLQSNHERREYLLQELEQINTHWGRQYKKMRQGILNEPGSPDQEEKADCQDYQYAPEAKEGDKQQLFEEASEPSGGNSNEKQDLNWDDILDHPPSSARVMAFLSARQLHQDTTATFHQVLDEIHAGIKEDANAINFVIEQFYDNMEMEFEPMERDIEYHLMTNSQRRQDLEARLHEAKKQSQGYFATLLSRLVGHGGKEDASGVRRWSH